MTLLEYLHDSGADWRKIDNIMVIGSQKECGINA